MADYEDKTNDELWDEMEHANPFDKGQILFELGRRKVEEHEHLQALAYFSQAVDVYRASTYEREYGLALLYKGNAHHALDEYEAAIELYVECAVITKTLGSDQDVAVVEHNMARSYAEMKRWQDAAIHSRAAENLHLACEHFNAAADAAIMNGGMHRRMGDYHEALHAFIRAYEHAEGLESTHNAFRAITNIAHMYMATGLHDEAITNARKALHLAKTCPCPICIPDSQLLLAQALIGSEQYELAMEYLEKAHSTFNAQSKAGWQGVCLLEMGRCGIATNHLGARETLEEAHTVLRTVNWTKSIARTLTALADLDLHEGNVWQACDKYQSAFDLIGTAESEATRQEIWLKLVNALWLNQDTYAAQRLLKEYDGDRIINHALNVQRLSTQCSILLAEKQFDEALATAEAGLSEIHPGEFAAQEAIFHRTIGQALRHKEPVRAEKENAKAVACYLAAGDVESATSLSNEHFIEPDKTLAAIAQSEADRVHAQSTSNSDFDSHNVTTSEQESLGSEQAPDTEVGFATDPDSGAI
jgi:tetratricopeptide (TPR) repeat protein